MKSRAVLMSLVLAALACTGVAPSASAQAPPIVTENMETVAEFTYRSGGSGVAGGTCGAACTALWDVQRTLPPNANPAVSEALTRELVRTGEQTATLPKPPLYARIGLGAQAFATGFWIGDVVNDKLLHIGGPAAPASPNYTGFSLAWVTQGTDLGYPAVAPRDGFYLQAQPGYIFAFKRWTGQPAGACSNLDPMPTEYVDLSVGQDGCNNGQGIGWRQLHAYVYDGDFTYRDPIQDYEGQPGVTRIGDWPNEPSSMAELEARVEDVVEGGAFGLATDLYAHGLAPGLYPDPRVTEKQHDHRCDLSSPAYKNPDGNLVPAPYTPKLADSLSTSGRPSGAEDAPDPYLRWGEATWGGQYLDNWPGWGYRHIAAKHGWGPADEAATRATLAAPVAEVEESPTSMRYLGLEYQQNGAVCQRLVKVEFGEHTGPKGIITSYGDYLGEAP